MDTGKGTFSQCHLRSRHGRSGQEQPLVSAVLVTCRVRDQETPLAVGCSSLCGAVPGPDSRILQVGSMGEAGGLRMTGEAVPSGADVH